MQSPDEEHPLPGPVGHPVPLQTSAGQKEAAGLRVDHLEVRFVLLWGAVQPESGGVLPLRAHVAHMAEAVPRGRGLSSGGGAGHAQLTVPLRPVGLPAVQQPRGEELHLAGPVRRHAQQGDVLLPALLGLPQGGGGHGGRQGVQEVPAAEPAHAGGGVPEVQHHRYQGRAYPGRQRAGPAHGGPVSGPEGDPPGQGPAGGGQLPDQVQARADPRELAGGAEQGPQAAARSLRGPRPQGQQKGRL